MGVWVMWRCINGYELLLPVSVGVSDVGVGDVGVGDVGVEKRLCASVAKCVYSMYCTDKVLYEICC